MFDTMKPIAIVGTSYKFAQGVEDDASFWNVLSEGSNLMTDWPEDRASLGSWYDETPGKLNVLKSRGGYFFRDDPFAFDAPFFGIQPKEAATMDPQQRQALEATYHALENSGIPVESIKGSRAGVFVAGMIQDYAYVYSKDPEQAPRLAVTGIALTAIPNKVSWYFDLHGPSVYMDTGCSGSMVAFDQACQSIQHGDSSMAIVLGINLLLTPESSVYLTNMGFLSPDSKCFSFDHRANGYARGEGVAAVVLKPLEDAIKSGDVIRGIIRATAGNQDGKTPILTQPSTKAQEALIRHVYQKAGLGFDATNYLEAHGTGTLVGDPIEMSAIGSVFRDSRSPDHPMHVGSVKACIGHTEATSGLASLIKTMLVLEKGSIPPNALFEKLNPSIDGDFLRVRVPMRQTAMPEGVRRASINSFGFGGSNVHVIMDDALNYLSGHGLVGYHNCAIISNSNPDHPVVINGTTHSTQDTAFLLENQASEAPLDSNVFTSQLLVWTAADNAAIKRVISFNEKYYWGRIAGSPSKLKQLAFTLAARRSHLAWRAFSIIDPSDKEFFTNDKTSNPAADKGGRSSLFENTKPMRQSNETVRIAFIFTGQGAQYKNMGLQLLQYPTFKHILDRCDAIFSSLGATWSICDVLQDESGLIDLPDYSQPLCTVLQLALIVLLKGFSIHPTAVIGHSSGEIAAAYAIGAISFDSACRIAYFRGQVAGKLRKVSHDNPGAMMSVNMSESDIYDYLNQKWDKKDTNIHVACINSPFNCTVSGEERDIDALHDELEKQNTFARKIKTGVAYHSPIMSSVAKEYLAHMENLEVGDIDSRADVPVTMISSVTGRVATPKMLATGQYWVDNLVSPVRFSDAVHELTHRKTTSDATQHIEKIAVMIEVGPHAALRKPLLDSAEDSSSSITYHSVLNRSQPAIKSLLSVAGSLFCHGYPVSITAVNGGGGCADDEDDSSSFSVYPTPAPLVDLPKYPFDRSKKYWAETRISKDVRLRKNIPPNYVLGKPSPDFNSLVPVYRNLFSADVFPWLKDHNMSKSRILPGSGFLVMAVEAVRLALKPGIALSGYFIKRAEMLAPLRIPDATDAPNETKLYLQPLQNQYEKEPSWFQISIYSFYQEAWTECFRAKIQLQNQVNTAQEVDHGREEAIRLQQVVEQHSKNKGACIFPIDKWEFYDYCAGQEVEFGPEFQLLNQLRWNGRDTAAGLIEMESDKHGKLSTDSPVHPIALDAAIHIAFLVLSKGLTQSTPTAVPHQVHNTWISATPWVTTTTTQEPGESDMSAASRASRAAWVTSTVRRDALKGIICTTRVVSDTGVPLVTIEELEMVQIASNNDSDDGDDNSIYTRQQQQQRDLMYRMDWKPLISVMNGRQLAEYCSSSPSAAAAYRDGALIQSTPRQEKSQLEEVARIVHDVIRGTLNQLETDPSLFDMATMPEHLRKLINMWRQRYGSQVSSQGNSQDNQDSDSNYAERFESTMTKYVANYPEWKLCLEVGCRLIPIFQGKVDVIDLFFGSDDAEKLYTYVFDTIYDNRISSFLELLSHNTPALRILEIGAGTGGMSQHILDTLLEVEERTGTARFVEYVYTDISAGFFEAARSKFSKALERITFSKLDIGEFPEEQGFELGAFDLVVAGNVLHATPDLMRTLTNAHSLVKPDGKLLLLELTKPDCPWTNMMFGIFPGWWLSTEDWRQYGPLATTDRWNTCLQEAGFSGIDMAIQGNDTANVTLMVSSKMAVTSLPVTTPITTTPAIGSPTEMSRQINGGRLVVLLNDDSPIQKAISQQIMRTHSHVVVSGIKDFDQTIILNIDVVISLLEVESLYLYTLNETGFGLLKNMIRKSSNLIWVSAEGYQDDDNEKKNQAVDSRVALNPHRSIASGFLRAMRAEEPSKRILSLAIEPVNEGHSSLYHLSTSYSQYIETLIQTHLQHVLDHPTTTSPQADITAVITTAEPISTDTEFIVRKGVFQIGRMVHDGHVERQVRSLSQQEVRQETLEQGCAVRLHLGTSGMIDTLRWEEDDEPENQPLKSNEVEIDAKVWPLSFRDILTVLGRVKGHDLGFETAGIVRRVGADAASKFQPGDRVCMLRARRIRMYPRGISDYVFKIPDHASFVDAVASLMPYLTAYHALNDIARLQVGEKILIHSAGGSTGQMAVVIAQRLGAEIIATVGSDSKKRLLMEDFGIPESHILYSRTTSFQQGVERLTSGKGVDVVLNSLSGDSLQASWECMAPYGRFIEIGKVDIHANTSLPMAMFANNVSFSAVDLHHIAETNVPLLRRLMLVAMGELSSKTLRLPCPLQVYPASQVEQAFRYMQSGKNAGRIIISLESPGDVITKFTSMKSNWKLSPNASYLVVGGFGGLGRCLLLWLASKGARNLIIPSRSGVSSKEAKDVLSELQERGVHVITPQCDVGSEAELAQALQAASTQNIPPIKGCINAAMDLQDSIFENMTFDQWDKTTGSKVSSSWNLHQQLPDTLDFFILFSSVTGLYGAMAQSNYAAGNTFQDALAKYRTGIGRSGVSMSFDLGWINDAGVIASNAKFESHRNSQGNLIQTYWEDVAALLEHYCSPVVVSQWEIKQANIDINCDDSQLIVGMATPLNSRAQGVLVPVMELPFLNGFAVAAANKAKHSSSQDHLIHQIASLFDQFSASTSVDARATVVVSALAERLSRALSVPQEDIDPRKPLSEFGVDSLMAVELRNWFRREFRANVSVFDLMAANISILSIGALIVDSVATQD